MDNTFDEQEVLQKLQLMEAEINKAKEDNMSSDKILKLQEKMLWNGMMLTQNYGSDW